MNKSELIAEVAAKAEITKKDADAAVTAVIDAITESLKKGDKVQLVGFGTFEVRERGARHRPRSPHQPGDPDSRFQGPCLQGWQGAEGHCQQQVISGVWADSECLRVRFFMPGERKAFYETGQISENFRLIKRRTVANEACDAGRVFVNGKPARASYDVKVGDLLELQLGERVV